MDLSILMPARNEMFLRETVEDVLKNARAKTEIIVILDGSWPVQPLRQDPRVHLAYLPTAIGQRAATNLAAMVSTAKYVMKLDAHCAVDEGFDVKLIDAAATLGENVTQIPAQYNLHAFDWVCQNCKKRLYQGPTPTSCECGKPAYIREMVWNAKRRLNEFWRFDSELKFQYWGAFKNRPEGQGELCDTMSCLGAAWFMSRARYWALDGMDEAHGSWGQMGTEIACKSWLSGGRLVTNRRTWYSHLFRTQGADFGFPYPTKHEEHEHARRYSRTLWRTNSWPGQVRSLWSLLDQFKPVPGWTEEAIDALERHVRGQSGGRDRIHAPAEVLLAGPAAGGRQPTKGVVYYSDCRGDERVLAAARAQIRTSVNGHQVVSVTLSPVDLGKNIVLDLKRGYLTMFKQILAGLEALKTDYAFLAEHDVLYSPDHFKFTPPTRDKYYYNLNFWKADVATQESGRFISYEAKQTSALCADRLLLVAHYRKRVALVEKLGFTRAMGFEPGSHGRPERVDDIPSGEWRSKTPIIDLRHGHNLTESRWSPAQFRNAPKNWQETKKIPGWGVQTSNFQEFLLGLSKE